MEKDKQSDQEEAFAQAVGQGLRESAEHLDAATLSRLNRARQTAISELDRKEWSAIGKAADIRWLPVGSMIAVATIAVVFWLNRVPEMSNRQVTPVPGLVVDEASNGTLDFELLLDYENFEMIEDLEFFAWLSEIDMEPAG